MFCPNCAQPVRDGAKFCEYCGFPLAGIRVPAQTPVTAEPEPEEEFDPSKNIPVLLYGPPPVSEPEEKTDDVAEAESVVGPEQVAEPEPDPIDAIVPEPTIAVAAEPTYQQTAYQQPAYQQQPTYQQPTYQQAYQQPTYQQQAAYQQPVYQQQAYQQPTYQQGVATQPTYGYQQAQVQQTAAYPQTGVPQAPVYTQAPASAQTEKKPFTKSVWFKVLIGVIIALLVYGICKAISTALTINNINNQGSGSSSSSSSDDDPFAIIDNIINSSTSTDLLDSEGNPTAYALLNQDGATVCDALEEIGWTFDDEYLLWSSEDENNAYYVCGPDDYEYTKSDIRRMSPNGGRDAAIMTLMLDDYDYDSFDEVIDKLIRVKQVDKFDAGEAVYLIIETESGESDLALLTYDAYSGLYRLDIANENAISSGFAEEFLGVYGTTIEDVWYDVAGRGIAEG